MSEDDAHHGGEAFVIAARRVFLTAGIYGLIVLGLFLFMEEWIGIEQPPPITHPEYFYGFNSVALAWQLAFLIIASDPVRFRPMMVPAMVEKIGFFGVGLVLYVLGRISLSVFSMTWMDGLFFLLFLWTYRRTPWTAPTLPPRPQEG